MAPKKRRVNKKHVDKARSKGLAQSKKKRLIARKKKQVSIKSLKKKGFSTTENKSRYKQGKFWSSKNKKEFVFRSAYEFGYFHLLEKDKNVVSYIVEPFCVPYRYNNVSRNYWPDLLVLYADGTMKVIEIKPAGLVNNRQVQAKAAGCKLFISKRLKNTTFEFITEKDIFESDADYKRLVKLIK